MSKWPTFGVSGEFLDFVEEREREEAKAADLRQSGNFHPYYVRRPESWRPFARWRWTIFCGTSDLRSSAPIYTVLPIFWRFKSACRVAYLLQKASQWREAP